MEKAEGDKVNFRASFEVPVKPLRKMLQDKAAWRGMRTMGQLCFEAKAKGDKRTKTLFKGDSLYSKPGDVQRMPLRRFHARSVPKKLENKLPFLLRPKLHVNAESNWPTTRRALLLLHDKALSGEADAHHLWHWTTILALAAW